MRGSFFFITGEIEFQEATKKGALILATLALLDTVSANDRIYRIEEGASIAKSLIGKPVRYGSDWLGRHLKKVQIIGAVEKAWEEGKKIKGLVRVWNKELVERLKKGFKPLFSIGGVAEFAELIKKGKKIITKLYNAVCTHLQLLPSDAGFPTAKMHKLIEINESVILTEIEKTVSVCDAYGCRILGTIRKEFEEALEKKAIEEAIEEKVINRAIAEDISVMIMKVVKEPWRFFEKEN